MKLSYNIQEFKNALKRNRFTLSEIYYRGNSPCQAKCFYMQTRKAHITYVPTSYLDAYYVFKETINNGYKLTEIGDFLNVAEKI